MPEPGPIPVVAYLLVEPTITRWGSPRRVTGARVIGVRQRSPDSASAAGLAVVKVTLHIDPAVFEPLRAELIVRVASARSVPALVERPEGDTDPDGC